MVGFALAMPVLLMVAAAVLQAILLVHVRTVLTLAAGEGARAGALVGASDSVARARARRVIDEALGEQFGAQTVITSGHQVRDGGSMSVVQITSHVLLGLGTMSLLPGGIDMTVQGHALTQEAT